ncbi:MAG: hypothetical protein IPL10_18225 [Bacteroidetes bacterium]|nr:hypothetical protein [Bacteroidota bacterium]
MLNPGLRDNYIYRIIIAHYISSAIFLLVISILLIFSTEAFLGHYFHPKVLAITHFTTLGWVTFIIIGSLYQLIPVITNKKIYSPILAFIVYVLILLGTVLLSISFWIFDVGFLIEIAACFLFLGITLFLINILLTMKDSKEKNIEIDFIQASMFWFWLTAFIGSLLAFNFRFTFLPKEHLYYLKIHAHIGLIGWFLCLIIGVASKLIPMFLLSGKLNTKNLTYSYYLINFGLLGFIIDALFFNGMNRVIVYFIIIFLALLLFLSYIANAFKTRARKKLDINLKYTYISFFLIFIPIILWVILKIGLITNKGIEQQISTAIVYSLLFGFITFLILGQSLKNLAFIVWLKKYQEISGKGKTPLPKDLYSEKIATVQLYIYVISFVTILSGILLSNPLSIEIGAVFMMTCAVIYNVNMYKIISHKVLIQH